MFQESVASSVPSLWAAMNSWFTPTVLFIFLNLMIGTIAITSNLGSNKTNNDRRRREEQQQNVDGSPARTLARSPSMLQRLKSINFNVYRSQEPPTVSYDQRAFHQDVQVHSFRQEEEEEQGKEQGFFTGSSSVLQRLNGYMAPREHQEEDTHFSFRKTHHEEEAKLNLYSSEEADNGEIQVAHEEEEKQPSLQLSNNGGGGEEEEEEEKNGKEEDEMTIDQVYSQLKSGAPTVNRSKSETIPVSGEVPARKMRKSASVKVAPPQFGKEDEVVEIRRPATVREGAAVKGEDEEVDAKADDFINKFKQQLKLQRIDSIIRYNEMITRGSEK